MGNHCVNENIVDPDQKPADLDLLCFQLDDSL